MYAKYGLRGDLPGRMYVLTADISNKLNRGNYNISQDIAARNVKIPRGGFQVFNPQEVRRVFHFPYRSLTTVIKLIATLFSKKAVYQQLHIQKK
jgi:hypothetical protein